MRAAVMVVVVSVACAPAGRLGRSDGQAPVTRALAVNGAPPAAVPPFPTAPWLEPALTTPLPEDLLESVAPPDLRPTAVLASAPGVLLAETDYGAFVVTETAGIDGPYQVGAHVAVGFGGDALYVVRPSGRVLRAPRVGGGLGPFVPRGLLDGATRWAFGASRIVAAVGDAVFVSVDAGLTFARRALQDGTVRAVFVGLDGALVVQATRTWVSKDAGQSFGAPIATPPLQQHGAWIFGDDDSCNVHRWIALGADGLFRRVSGPPAASTSLELHGRAQALAARFDVSEVARPRPPAAMPWPDRDTPPPGAPYGGYPACIGGGRIGSGRKTKAVQRIDEGSEITPQACAGLACARAQRPRIRSQTSALLLGDGVCADRAACVAASPWAIAPHLLFVRSASFHVSSVATLEAPIGCRPGWVTSSGGLVILACRSSVHRTTLWAADATRELRLEAVLPFGDELGPDDLQMVEDGSALFAAYGHEATDARAWIRRPTSVGAERPFREVTHALGVAYLLHPGAEVDIVVAEADGSFSIVVDAPAGVSRVVSGARIVGDLFCVGRKDGRRVGLRRTPAGGFRRLRFRHDGVDDDGIALDGGGRLSPSCGL